MKRTLPLHLSDAQVLGLVFDLKQLVLQVELYDLTRLNVVFEGVLGYEVLSVFSDLEGIEEIQQDPLLDRCCALFEADPSDFKLFAVSTADGDVPLRVVARACSVRR